MTTLTQPQISKQCNKCSIEKPLTDYYKDKSTKTGYATKCKDCQKSYNKLYKDKVGAGFLAQTSFKSAVKRLYGIDYETYQQMLDKQGGKCALCPRTSSEGKRLCVDHCHETGQVRGLLCDHCNTALGKFNDDIERIYKAAKYLEASKSPYT